MPQHPFLTPSPYEADEGHLIGRGPREISAEKFRSHLPGAVVGLKVIRAKCMECCNENATEVRKCTCVSCPLWHLRMGSQPKGLRVARNQGET